MKDRSLDRSAGLQIWRVISSAGCMERGACSPFIQQYINTDTHTLFLLLRASYLRHVAALRVLPSKTAMTPDSRCPEGEA